MAGRKSRKDVFSVTKAVKANARERVGQPPVEKVLPDESRQEVRKRKHKVTLARLLSKQDQS